MNNFLFSVYNKIIKQSKKNFFFNKFLIPNNYNSRLEIFQLNLIIVLWYMKFSKIEKKSMEQFINYFIKDLEYLLREVGESDSSIPKKIRKLVENFYGRLKNYSDEFDNICKKKNDHVGVVLNKNFKSKKIKYDSIRNYIRKNILYFAKLKKIDFQKLNFDFYSDI